VTRPAAAILASALLLIGACTPAPSAVPTVLMRTEFGPVGQTGEVLKLIAPH
jgi:hypothetical protein